MQQHLAHLLCCQQLTDGDVSCMQGKFKAPTPAKDIWVGQELLNKPLLPVR